MSLKLSKGAGMRRLTPDTLKYASLKLRFFYAQDEALPERCLECVDILSNDPDDRVRVEIAKREYVWRSKPRLAYIALDKSPIVRQAIVSKLIAEPRLLILYFAQFPPLAAIYGENPEFRNLWSSIVDKEIGPEKVPKMDIEEIEKLSVRTLLNMHRLHPFLAYYDPRRYAKSLIGRVNLLIRYILEKGREIPEDLIVKGGEEKPPYVLTHPMRGLLFHLNLFHPAGWTKERFEEMAEDKGLEMREWDILLSEGYIVMLKDGLYTATLR